MKRMSRKGILKVIDVDRVRQAVETAEKRTSGEIRVSVSTFFWGDVRRTAERAFRRLGMDRTQQRNGILFFVVPSRRRFVVLGDEGIHAKVGQKFWETLSRTLSDKFRDGRFTEGLVEAIRGRVGLGLGLDNGFQSLKFGGSQEARQVVSGWRCLDLQDGPIRHPLLG